MIVGAIQHFECHRHVLMKFANFDFENNDEMTKQFRLVHNIFVNTQKVELGSFHDFTVISFKLDHIFS